MKRFFFTLAILLLLGVMGYSGYKFISAQKNYAAERNAHTAILQFKPAVPADTSGTEAPAAASSDPAAAGIPIETTEPFVNQEILDLQAQYPDAVGWITIPNTNVDYPLVQAKDNDYYLHRSLDKEYLYAGTPFLDYRCAEDFSDQNSIIYGHNMRNGSVFGALESFKNADFFEENKIAYVFLPHQTLTVEIFACVVKTPSDAAYLYKTVLSEAELAQISQDARHYRPVALSQDDSLITISTCDYEFTNGRVILVGRVK